MEVLSCLPLHIRPLLFLLLLSLLLSDSHPDSWLASLRKSEQMYVYMHVCVCIRVESKMAKKRYQQKKKLYMKAPLIHR